MCQISRKLEFFRNELCEKHAWIVHRPGNALAQQWWLSRALAKKTQYRSIGEWLSLPRAGGNWGLTGSSGKKLGTEAVLVAFPEEASREIVIPCYLCVVCVHEHFRIFGEKKTFIHIACSIYICGSNKQKEISH